MKHLIMFASLLLTTPAAAESALTVHRVNFKNTKLLHYDLNYDARKCVINPNQPFDVYYTDTASGARLSELSSDSQDYFGPRIKGPAQANQVELQFKAFDEIQKATNMRGQITVKLENVDGQCRPRTEIAYQSRVPRRYELLHIDIKMKLTFGFPTGVSYVLLKGKENGAAVTDCVVGRCD